MTVFKRSGFLAITFLCIFVFSADCQRHFDAIDGWVDLRDADLTNHVISVGGRWQFYWDRVVMPDEVTRNQTKTTKIVPSVWNDFNKERKGTGCGTYVANIIVHDTVTKAALEIPQLYSSYNLFVDGKLIAKVGNVSLSPENATPEWKRATYTFDVSRDTMQIILQVSNFSHHKGGIREPILYGTPEQIGWHFTSAFISTWSLSALLVILTVAFVVLYRSKKKNPEILFFALLCVSWSIRLLFTDIYVIKYFIPNISWGVLVRIEYVSFLAVIIFGTLFVSTLLKEHSGKMFTWLVTGFAGFFIVFILFSNPLLFTRWLSLYLGLAIIVLLYALYLTIRGLLSDKAGVWSLMTGLFLVIVLTGYDMIAFQGVVVNNLMIKNGAYGIIFIGISIGILQHLEIIKGDSKDNRKLTMEDFYHKS